MISFESDYIAGALRHKLVNRGRGSGRASENSGGTAVTCRRCLIQNQDRSA